MTLAAAPAALAATTPLLQTGGSGDGAGQLQVPRGIAIDEAGDVYVADEGNHRISVFDSAGNFLRAFGKAVVAGDPQAAGFGVCTGATGCQTGIPSGEPGGLATPVDIALNAAGHLYVAEAFNQRISEYDVSTLTPTFVRAFGWNVVPGGPEVLETCTTTCQAGVGGEAAGQFSEPASIALDDAGGLYVSQFTTHRVDRFDISGASVAFAHGFGAGVDSGVEQFEVCTGASGCQSGWPGPAFAGVSGQLRNPRGIALDGSGRLYVGDLLRRVSVFDVSATPQFVHAFGFGVDTSNATIEFEVCTNACTRGSSIPDAGSFTIPRDVAIDGTGRLAVTDGSAQAQRVSLFDVSGPPSFLEAFGWGVDSGAAAFEVCTLASGCQFGSGGPGLGQLDLASGAAVDCHGALWVVNSGDGRVQRFGEPGTGSSDCRPVTPPPPPPPPGGGGGGGGGGGPKGPIGAPREPLTLLGKRPAKRTGARSVRFQFSSDQADAKFQCKLDRRPFQRCRSPKAYSNLAPGRHVFRVRAVSPLGFTDLTPARFRWVVTGG